MRSRAFTATLVYTTPPPFFTLDMRLKSMRTSTGGEREGESPAAVEGEEEEEEEEKEEEEGGQRKAKREKSPSYSLPIFVTFTLNVATMGLDAGPASRGAYAELKAEFARR